MGILNKLFSVSEDKNKRIIRIFGIKISYKSETLKYKNMYNDSVAESERYLDLMNIISSPEKCPAAVGKLRQDQIANIQLLMDIKSICERENITYWIDFGTLLGAVRHKGFIPWDTDIDTVMQREDVLRIIPLLKEKYSGSQFEVREQARTAVFQIRIKDKNDNNIGTDIFPLDKYPKGNLDETEKKEVDARVRIAQKMLRDKYYKKPEATGDINKIREYIYYLNKNIVCQNQEDFSEKCAFFYSIDFPLPHPNLVRNYEDIFPLKTIEFEGEVFPCPNNIEKHLSYFYSKNYMQFPKSFRRMDRFDEYIDGLITENEKERALSCSKV